MSRNTKLYVKSRKLVIFDYVSLGYLFLENFPKLQFSSFGSYTQNLQIMNFKPWSVLDVWKRDSLRHEFQPPNWKRHAHHAEFVGSTSSSLVITRWEISRKGTEKLVGKKDSKILKSFLTKNKGDVCKRERERQLLYHLFKVEFQ